MAGNDKSEKIYFHDQDYHDRSELVRALGNAYDNHDGAQVAQLLAPYCDKSIKHIFSESSDSWLSMCSAARQGNINYISAMLELDAGDKYQRSLVLESAAEKAQWDTVILLLEHNIGDQKHLKQALHLAYGKSQKTIDAILDFAQNNPKLNHIADGFIHFKLGKACENNDVKETQNLLEQGALFEQTSGDEAWIILKRHINKGHFKMAQLMIDNNVGSKHEKTYAFKAAVEAKKYDMAEQIFSQGMSASGSGFDEAMEAIVKHGKAETLFAKIIPKIIQENSHHDLPKVLTAACEAEHYDFVKILFENDIKFENRILTGNPGDFLANAVKKNNQRLFDLLLTHPDLLAKHIDSALQACFENNKSQYLDALLGHNISDQINIANLVANHDQQKLHSKLQHSLDAMKETIAASDQLQEKLQDELNNALHRACDDQDETLALLLAERGAKITNTRRFLRGDYDEIFDKACDNGNAKLAALIANNHPVAPFTLRWAFRRAGDALASNGDSAQQEIALNLLQNSSTNLEARSVANLYVSMITHGHKNKEHSDLVWNALEKISTNLDRDIQAAAAFEMIYAAKEGDIKKITALLDVDVNINHSNRDDETALSTAIEHNKNDCALFLLENGAQADNKSIYECLIKSNNTMLLELAARDEQKRIVKNGHHYMRKALIWGEASTVEILINHGALEKCDMYELGSLRDLAERDSVKCNDFIIQSICEKLRPFIAKERFSNAFNDYCRARSNDNDERITAIGEIFNASCSSPTKFLDQSSHDSQKSRHDRAKRNKRGFY